MEAWCLQRDFNERDVVDLSGDAVHSISGRADEDLVFAWDAEGAEERIDGFVGADTHEEVVGCESFRGVSVRVTEVAKVLLEFYLVSAEVLSASIAVRKR